MPLEMPEEELKKRFPHIAKEMEESSPGDAHTLRVKTSPNGYQPNVYDFLARCDNNKQAMEIVDYLERRGELPKEEAEGLRRRINEHGVRSLVKKRAPGYYFREFGD